MENYDLSSTFRIAELILHQQENKLSVEDAKELAAWLQAGERNEILLAECSDENNLDEFIDLYFSATDTDIAFETKIAPHLRGEEGIQKKEAVVRRFGDKRDSGKFYRMTGIAAAALIATVTTVLWYAHFNAPGPLQTGSRSIALKEVARPGANTAVLPGREKAILTLSNGEKITLDSMPDGLVSIEGATRVMKSTKGLLSYGAGQTGIAPAKGSLGTSGPALYNDLSVPRGGTYKVVLPDGTIAWLNAASSLRYPVAFNGNDRTITLSGEAYFEVAKDPTKPFIVNLSHKNTHIQVLGTHFNVLAYEEEPISMTTVIEGSVKVTAGTGASGTLQKGQQATTNADGALQVASSKDADDAIAWTNNRLSLNGNIAGIMRNISRWYDMPVEYKGKVDLTGPAFGGYGSVPRDSSLTYVLNVLQATGSIHFSIENRRIIVTP